ncbi:accessory Sec system protein Asp2 [Streptococcus marmotae]|uniref:accessory Sec system protein Asp2 n=1 Tax=Streptococcus marmotae TaxID=1825069 RepID=UPI00083142B2|nr:accessory Sec system protein Asp2 [Streptococcus marmotae]
MSKKKIRLLQIGHHNWQDEAEIPENIDWIYLQPQEILSFLQAENKKLEARYQKEKAKFPKKKDIKRRKVKVDGIILTEPDYPSELLLLDTVVEPYHVFFPKDLATSDPILQEFLFRKLGQQADFSDKPSILRTFSKIFFGGQFGQKIGISSFGVQAESEKYLSHYEGNHYLVLDGEYGEDYRVIGSFLYGVPIYKDVQVELWQEFVKEASCDVKIQVKYIADGSLGDIVEEWEFEGDELQEPNAIDSDYNGSLSVSILARGKGFLKIGPLHYRWGRAGFGQFSLGGQRFCDSERREFNYFFHPGDFKPPLCVYFSGFRTAEGFEGYGMMRNLGTPMLLICDPRLEGGSFYMGTGEFEAAISATINQCLAYLGFSNKELILSGMSMGTFGATYYGADLDPHAIILSKPIFSLGRTAALEKTIRPGGFPTSLDLLLHFEGDLSEEAQVRFNQRFWNKIKSGHYTNTKFFIAYMKNDDYDHAAFQNLMECFAHTDVQVVGKGWIGRHLDGSSETIPWFLNQYQKVLQKDFGRGET